MKNLAVLTTLTAILFTGATTHADTTTNETLDDVVKITALKGIGYEFELSHKSCSKDKHIITSATKTVMITPDTDKVSQKTADNLATLYKETFGKAMGEPFDAFMASYNADEINSWQKAVDRGQKPQAQPTKGMLDFLKSARAEFQAFYDGLQTVVDTNDTFLNIRMGGVAADTPSPLCN